MSARITLSCDTQWCDGSCPTRLLTDAHTIDEARTAARARGWRTNGAGDFCPTHSGRGSQPAGAVVAILHPTQRRE